MEKRKRIPVGTWIITAISILAAVGTVLYASSNTAKATRNINLANYYLSNLDYENASIAYSEALEFDPENLEALRGLMKSAYAEEDYKTLARTIKTFASLVSSEDLSISDELLLLSMTQNSSAAFDSPSDYNDFVNDIYKKTGSEDLGEVIESTALSSSTELLAQGKYLEAYELIKDLINDSDGPLSKDFIKDFLTKAAELAWNNSDYKNAFEYLRKVLELFPDDETTKDYLLLVSESYVNYLINNQMYDEAKEAVDWLQKTRNDDFLNDIVDDISDMETVDSNLQNIIEELNVAFDNDDIDTIQSIMNSWEFVEYTAEIENVLYCDSLKGSGRVSGSGTAIYNVDGTPYVYYGSYSNGKRSGYGLWYTSEDTGNLSKYSVNWENDLPNGSGTLDQYVTFTFYSYGGEETGKTTEHTISNFTAENGILVGTYTTNINGSIATWNLVNGYAPQIVPGEYPDYLLGYMAYPQTLSAYIYNEWGNSYWWTWTPGQWTIDGLGVLSGNLGYEEEGMDIFFN